MLGQAFKEALDGFKGIRRFGHAYIPMDETLSRCAIDLSNRPYLIWKVGYQTPKVGDMLARPPDLRRAAPFPSRTR